MFDVQRTDVFIRWIEALRDNRGAAAIAHRLRTLEIVVLLCGGDKRSQKRDIERAVRLAENVEI